MRSLSVRATAEAREAMRAIERANRRQTETPNAYQQRQGKEPRNSRKLKERTSAKTSGVASRSVSSASTDMVPRTKNPLLILATQSWHRRAKLDVSLGCDRNSCPLLQNGAYNSKMTSESVQQLGSAAGKAC